MTMAIQDMSEDRPVRPADDVPRTVKASEFKAKCLQLLDEVADSGSEIVITKNGRPVSRLVPYRKPMKAPFGRDRDIIKIHGDIVSPMPAEWFGDSEDTEGPLL